MHPHNSVQGLPPAHGLYDPRFEHDACGVSFVADIEGRASHDIVARGLGALCNMEHRGATGAEADTGDGAGVLIQIPDRFLRAVVGFDLPASGAYAVGMAFLPGNENDANAAQSSIDAIFAEEDLPADQQHMIQLNAELALLPGWKSITKRKTPMPDADDWKDKTGKLPHLVR